MDATGQPYAYAADNPVNFADPLGLDSCSGAQGANGTWGRLVSAVASTGCSIGQAAGGVANTAIGIVAPPCDLASGGCRPPTPTEVATQADQWRAAAGSAVGTTAQDVGMAIRPPCIPGVQSCEWQSPQEMRQTAATMLIGAYGAINVLTYGMEANLGQYAGLPDLSCTPEFQRGTRLANAGNLIFATYRGLGALRAFRAAGMRVGSAADGIYSSVTPMQAGFPELDGVNPHYVPGAPRGVNTNCVSCVNAATQRLTGADPNARPL